MIKEKGVKQSCEETRCTIEKITDSIWRAYNGLQKLSSKTHLLSAVMKYTHLRYILLVPI